MNETLEHERIQEAFNAFSKTIRNYGGIAHELHMDTFVAEFNRTFDAVTAGHTRRLGGFFD